MNFHWCPAASASLMISILSSSVKGFHVFSVFMSNFKFYSTAFFISNLKIFSEYFRFNFFVKIYSKLFEIINSILFKFLTFKPIINLSKLIRGKVFWTKFNNILEIEKQIWLHILHFKNYQNMSTSEASNLLYAIYSTISYLFLIKNDISNSSLLLGEIYFRIFEGLKMI